MLSRFVTLLSALNSKSQHALNLGLKVPSGLGTNTTPHAHGLTAVDGRTLPPASSFSAPSANARRSLGACGRNLTLLGTPWGDKFIEVRVQAVRLKLRPLAAVRLTLAL